MSSRPGDDRFPALDGIRGLAALAIVATHTGFASGRSGRHDLLAAVLGRADFGVAVFFLLSGFLLYRPYCLQVTAGTRVPRPLRFWWRRALRILPAMWVTVAVTLSLITTRHVTLQDWWQYLLLVHVYDHHEVDPNLTQLWTLSAEIAFYALIPLFGAAVASRVGAVFERQLIVVGTLFGLSVAFDAVQHVLLSHNQAQLWLPAYLDWFALGMLLAVLSTDSPAKGLAARFVATPHNWAAAPGTCYAVAVILWSLTLTQLGVPRSVVLASFWQWTLQHYLYGAAAFFLLLPLVLNPPGEVVRILGSRVGSLLGKVSYGVYLWHLALLLLIQRELGYAAFSGHFWTLLALTTAASLGVAAASWYGLERPILRYGSRFPRHAPPGQPPVSASSTAPTIKS